MEWFLQNIKVWLHLTLIKISQLFVVVVVNKNACKTKHRYTVGTVWWTTHFSHSVKHIDSQLLSEPITRLVHTESSISWGRCTIQLYSEPITRLVHTVHTKSKWGWYHHSNHTCRIYRTMYTEHIWRIDSEDTQSYSDPIVMLMSWPTINVEWNHWFVSKTTAH